MRPPSPVLSRTSPGGDVGRSFGILSTFPPTACGIATFSAALASGLLANGDRVEVVRCGPAPMREGPLVGGALGDGSPARLAEAIDVLNGNDVAVVQHEYGLYDGADGDSVVGVLDGVRVPLIVVAHTVLRAPTAHQRTVLEQVCDAADAVVVMTQSARSRLLDGFDVDPTKVSIIAHGAATPGASRRDNGPTPATGAPRLLTWGLLGPGKGIEWAIDAVASLGDLHPHPTYMIAGATHPKVLASSGEAYRQMLERRVRSSGAAPHVVFDGAYRDLDSLTELIRSADLVVLPYDSEEQVTSGVLVDAVAAGRPVVSTAFPHAVELLASGAGLVVPQRDPGALADAIRAVLGHPDLAASMAAEARRLAPRLSWAAVAAEYDELAGSLLAAHQPVRT